MSGSADSKIPQHMTTPADRFWLRITRSLPAESIGPEVSQSVMEKAFNRRRVGTNVGMCVLTAVSAFILIQNSKKRRKEKVIEKDNRFG